MLKSKVWGVLFLAILCSMSQLEALRLESSAFSHQSHIPGKYACQGDNLSPPLHASLVPKDAKSLVLILEDPDATRGVFTHWLVWNIPTQMDWKEGEVSGIQGSNGRNRLGYTGPCPPAGDSAHHYVFKLYALDEMLDLPAGAKKVDLEKAIQGHILAQTQFVGLYARQSAAK